MDLSTVALPSVGEKPATLFVALELSKASWLVALHSPAADKVSLHRLAGGDVQELLTLIGLASKKWRALDEAGGSPCRRPVLRESFRMRPSASF
jgi:hypothetical protein